MLGLEVPVPDMGGMVELVVPFPQPGKKATAVTAPNKTASGIFEREQQDFGFIDQSPYIISARPVSSLHLTFLGMPRVQPSNTTPACVVTASAVPNRIRLNAEMSSTF